MNTAVVICGAGFGDEGKGLMTDYFASIIDNPIVVRFNGGAQAGHTVVTPDDKRHIFSHFSSGTFTGAPTYLTKEFVVNPLLFKKEHEEFVNKFGITPLIIVDPSAEVSTPMDMMLNQSLEIIQKHGSCGVGFGETLERVKRGIHFNVDDLTTFNQAKRKYDTIRDYFLSRAPKEADSGFIFVAKNDSLFEDFLEAIEYFNEHTEEASTHALKNKNLIFEGAQGLLLDQDYGHFPYVTRSNTGMRNVTPIIKQLNNIKSVTVNYITRAYTTRHGEGPLDKEEAMPKWVQDNTNMFNKWQGSLRYAPLNYDLFKSITDKDFALYGNDNNGSYSVKRINTMTHIDQLQREAKVKVNDHWRCTQKDKFLLEMKKHFNILTEGSTRDLVDFQRL